MTIQLRTLALGLLLVSGVAHAGLFSKKKAPPPPPPPPVEIVAPTPPPPPPPPIPLEFSGIQTAAPVDAPLDRLQSASAEVVDTVQWVSATKDNAGLPFVVVDKVNAQVYAFTPYAQLKATAPVLLGAGVGDVALVPQDAPMSAMPPNKRITPAGRYPSRLVIDNHGKTVLLVDGPNLITMHIVAKGTPAQRRAERLASVTSGDNRVSFGCVNVPPAFFTSVIDPDFRPRQGIVYILPEKTTAAQMYGFQPRVAAPLPQALLTAADNLVRPTAALELQPSPTAAPVTQASPTALQVSAVAPQASTFAPPATAMVPQAAAIAPQAATIAPQAAPMAPPATTIAPPASPMSGTGASADPSATAGAK